jgi:hypothetical protein
METKRFSLNPEELRSIFKVLLWSLGSALVVALIGIVQALDVPQEWLFLVPIVNTVLYSLKEFFQGK